MNADFMEALDVLENDKGIDKEIVLEAIEAALISAYKRNFNQAQNVRVDVNRDTGSIQGALFSGRRCAEAVLHDFGMSAATGTVRPGDN